MIPKSSITKESVRTTIDERDFVALVVMFDTDPDRVRRFVMRLTYNPDDPLHDKAIEGVFELAKARSAQMPEFFREMMRRNLWEMNEEGGNIPWSAPELISAVVAGNPTEFRQFFGFAFKAAIDEPTFQPSLVRGYHFIAAVDENLVSPYAEEILELQERLGL